MKVNQLRVGSVLSYVNLAIGSIIPMFYTPIMLRILGQAEYGLFGIANSVTGYLSLLNFGFGSTIVRYIVKYKSEGENEKVRKTFGFFIAAYGIVAVLALIGGVVLSLGANVFFSQGLTTSEIEKLRILILLMAFNTAVSFPISVFSSIITSYERFIFRRILDVFGTVAAPCLNLVLLYFGWGSVGLTLSTTILTFLTFPISMYYCFKRIGIYPRFSKPESSFVKETMTFSVYVFIGTIVDILFWATDKVLLGALAGAAVVAIYNVGATFNSILMSLSQAISGVLGPKVTQMVTKDGDNKTALSELFIRIGRLQYLLLALVVSGFIAFGQDFLTLWAGDEYAESYYIALMTMIPLVVPYIQNTGLSIVVAQNKHQFRSLVYLAIAVLNAVSTFFAIPYLGGIGAALCSCISYILGQGFIMNTYYYKVTGIDIPKFWREILKMSIVPAILCAVTIVVSRFVSFDSWWILLLSIAIYTLLYVVFEWIISMNRYEKDIVLVPIRKIFNKNEKEVD